MLVVVVLAGIMLVILRSCKLSDDYYDAVKVDGDHIVSALWEYHKKNNTYPRSLKDLDVILTVSEIDDWALVAFPEYPNAFKIDIKLKGRGYLLGRSEALDKIEWRFDHGH